MSLQTAPAPTWSPRVAVAWVAGGSAGLLALAAVLGVLVPSTGRAGPALLVVAGLVGLPHGAVDHLALGWAAGRDTRPARVLLAAYAVGAAAVALVALAAPVPAVLLLLVLSAAHFAEGEVALDRLRGGSGLLLPAVALGTAVVTLPLLLRPAAVQPLLEALDPSLPGVLAPLRVPVLVLTALLVAAGLAAAAAHGARCAGLELALAVGAFLVAPPLLVFAVWFGGWHAPRHLVRLLDLQPSGDLRARAVRLARAAALPTAASLAGLAVLVAVGGRGVPASVLVVLLALTVPHAAVVAGIGRAAGAKSRPRP